MTSSGPTTIFTIGHSNHSITEFVSLLETHGVTAVADVRSVPYSRVRPEFNRQVLERALGKASIAYLFLGRELGARPEDPTLYEGGRIKYSKLARTELFRSGLERVMSGAQSGRIALLCAEKEPLACHRSILVSRELEKLGANMVHIHSDGRLEPHGEAMERLLTMFGLEKEDMFSARPERIEQACARQEQRIAYVDPRYSRMSPGKGE